MAIPRVFLSSTCYDLSEVRDSIGSFIEGMGLEPCLSDRGDVFYHPDLHTQDSCLNEISNCHLFVLLIGGRFGGSYNADPARSIVNAEYAAAKQLNLPVFAFIKREVLEDHRVYKKNKAKSVLSEIDFPSIENQSFAQEIFEFIDEVRHAKVNNGFFGFEYSRDIEDLLRKQWSAMFFDFLQRRQLAGQYESHNQLLSTLTSTTGQLDDLVKRLYRHVDEDNADSVIEDVELRSEAERFFREIFGYFGLPGFYLTPLEQLVKAQTDCSWFQFLANTEDFDIETNATESPSGRNLDILTHLGTATCIGLTKPYSDPTKIALYDHSFEAFTKLTSAAKEL